MTLPAEVFLGVVTHTPLVAIDLVLCRGDGAVLLGRRVNRPAQGFWFVPGGRILKDEPLAEARARIVRKELGAAVPLDGWRLLGAYDHLYDDNFAGVAGVTTHYVVLAHTLQLGAGDVALEADAQHEELRWFAVEELLQSPEVHANTKAYFEAAGRA